MTPNTPAGGAVATVLTVACVECGMTVALNEYHPYAACLMFKACRDGDTVRANLPPPATVPLDAVRGLMEADRALDAVLERDRLRREAGSMLRFTEEIEIARAVRNAALDELEALTRGEK